MEQQLADLLARVSALEKLNFLTKIILFSFIIYESISY